MEDIEPSYDDSVLEKKVGVKTGKDVILHATLEVKDFMTLEESVVAILVDTKNNPGLIFVDGKPSIPTGPDKIGTKLLILDPGQHCDVLGCPRIRCFVAAETAT